jgi:hypothetical protein
MFYYPFDLIFVIVSLMFQVLARTISGFFPTQTDYEIQNFGLNTEQDRTNILTEYVTCSYNLNKLFHIVKERLPLQEDEEHKIPDETIMSVIRTVCQQVLDQTDLQIRVPTVSTAVVQSRVELLNVMIVKKSITTLVSNKNIHSVYHSHVDITRLHNPFNRSVYSNVPYFPNPDPKIMRHMKTSSDALNNSANHHYRSYTS